MGLHSKLETFECFQQLPSEIKSMIWRQNARVPYDEPIVVRIRRVPIYQKATTRRSTRRPAQPARLIWKHEIYSNSSHRHLSALLRVNHEVRAEVKRLNPNFLRIDKNGPEVRFNAVNNVIFLAWEALFAVGKIFHESSHPEGRLQGFDRVINLSIPSRYNVAILNNLRGTPGEGFRPLAGVTYIKPSHAEIGAQNSWLGFRTAHLRRMDDLMSELSNWKQKDMVRRAKGPEIWWADFREDRQIGAFFVRCPWPGAKLQMPDEVQGQRALPSDEW